MTVCTLRVRLQSTSQTRLRRPPEHPCYRLQVSCCFLQIFMLQCLIERSTNMTSDDVYKLYLAIKLYEAVQSILAQATQERRSDEEIGRAVKSAVEEA